MLLLLLLLPCHAGAGDDSAMKPWLDRLATAHAYTLNTCHLIFLSLLPLLLV
jgi:hypothetical protein